MKRTVLLSIVLMAIVAISASAELTVRTTAVTIYPEVNGKEYSLKYNLISHTVEIRERNMVPGEIISENEMFIVRKPQEEMPLLYTGYYAGTGDVIPEDTAIWIKGYGKTTVVMTAVGETDLDIADLNKYLKRMAKCYEKYK